jgi:cell division transport system permease protein
MAKTPKLKQNMQMRRRWMTFLRMFRYGVNNFSRNAWLTVAATAVMTITLLVILTTVLTQRIFNDTITDLRSKVDISIYLKNDTPQKDIDAMQKKLVGLSNVASVRYISPAEAQSIYNEQNKTDLSLLKELADITKDTGSLIPSSFRIRVKDLEKVDDVKNFVNKDTTFQADINSKLPNYGGDKQEAINSIARTASFAESAGLTMSIIFVIISILIIFNTIRMAIFNRREEIQMMKLIGADKNFIRGPFIIEACMYGFFAALVAVGSIYALMVTAQPTLSGYGITTGPTVNFMETFPALVLLIAIVIGALLGIISSMLAVRRYLKV